MIEPGSTLDERDDVVDLGCCAAAPRPSHLTLVLIAFEDLDAHCLPAVVVWRCHGLHHLDTWSSVRVPTVCRSIQHPVVPGGD